MAIPLKTRSEVGDAIKRSMERIQKAMDIGNYGYACQMLRDILHKEPGFNEARFQLRQAQLEKIGFSVNFSRRLLAMLQTAYPVYVKGPSQLRKGNLAQALEIAENAMDRDPTLLSTLLFLRQSAKAAGLIEIAVNTMEIAVRFNPKSAVAHRALAEDYQEAGDAAKAVAILQKVCDMQPNNLSAVNDLKHATALAAMEHGGWERADSFKDVMKDQDQAEILEQEARLVIRDPEARMRVIERTRAELQENPESPGLYKKLATLLAQHHEYAEAIEAYSKVMELTGAYDPGIDAQITELIAQQYQARIEQARAAGEGEEEITARARERDQILLERLQKRVKSFPNELNFRFELGYLYLQVGRIDEALKEFQHAQRSSHLASKARFLMGKCFNQKGVYDMAIEHFELAATDKDHMPAEQYKEILYQTGIAYENQNDIENALRKFKELYALDVQYRDIAERIDKYYQTRADSSS